MFYQKNKNRGPFSTQKKKKMAAAATDSVALPRSDDFETPVLMLHDVAVDTTTEEIFDMGETKAHIQFPKSMRNKKMFVRLLKNEGSAIQGLSIERVGAEQVWPWPKVFIWCPSTQRAECIGFAHSKLRQHMFVFEDLMTIQYQPSMIRVSHLDHILHVSTPIKKTMSSDVEDPVGVAWLTKCAMRICPLSKVRSANNKPDIFSDLTTIIAGDNAGGRKRGTGSALRRI